MSSTVVRDGRRIKATKLTMKKLPCDALWVGSRTGCTQVAKYEIGNFYYCTTHAKIRALKEILK